MKPKRSAHWPSCCRTTRCPSCCSWRPSGPRSWSYGMTSKLLQDVLPIEEPVNTFTIRQHVANVAERLEQELGDEQFCFVEGCQRSWDELPSPDGPLTVGIDGGYVRGQHKQGQLEVIAGQSLLAFKRDQEGKQQLSGRCFAWVQTYDEKPKRRLFELLQSQGKIGR